jgi:hypothetical protein
MFGIGDPTPWFYGDSLKAAGDYQVVDINNAVAAQNAVLSPATITSKYIGSNYSCPRFVPA